MKRESARAAALEEMEPFVPWTPEGNPAGFGEGGGASRALPQDPWAILRSTVAILRNACSIAWEALAILRSFRTLPPNADPRFFVITFTATPVAAARHLRRSCGRPACALPEIGIEWREDGTSFDGEAPRFRLKRFSGDGRRQSPSPRTRPPPPSSRRREDGMGRER
jgi:hypothetical protein